MFKKINIEKVIDRIMTIVAGIVCVAAILAAVGLIWFFFNLLGAMGKDYNEQRDALKVAYEQNYTCYLDGKEIELNKVDATQYNYRVNTDTNTVYLTERPAIVYVPTYMPTYTN